MFIISFRNVDTADTFNSIFVATGPSDSMLHYLTFYEYVIP